MEIKGGGGFKVKDIYTIYDVVMMTCMKENNNNMENMEKIRDAKEAARQLRLMAVIDAMEEMERKRHRNRNRDEETWHDGKGKEEGKERKKINVAIVLEENHEEENNGENTIQTVAERFEAEMKAMGIERVRTVITSHPLVQLSAIRKAHITTPATATMPASLARGGVPLDSFVAAMKERELELFSNKPRAEKAHVEVTVIRSRCGGAARVTRMTAKERKSFARHMTSSSASSEQDDDLEQTGLGLKITLHDGSMFFAKSAVLEAGENQVRNTERESVCVYDETRTYV